MRQNPLGKANQHKGQKHHDVRIPHRWEKCEGTMCSQPQKPGKKSAKTALRFFPIGVKEPKASDQKQSNQTMPYQPADMKETWGDVPPQNFHQDKDGQLRSAR